MKKQSLFMHGAWLVVATAAFVLGFQWRPTQVSKELSSSLPGSQDSLMANSSRSANTGSDAAEDPLRVSNAKSAVLTERDIELLGERFRTSTSPIERRLAFSRLLEGLTAENALQIRKQIEHLDHRRPEFREFHYAWGAVAGVEAALFGAGTEEDDMSPALAGWASASPSEALKWFKELDMPNNPAFDPLLKDRKLKPDGLRRHLTRGLVQGLANADPNIAGDYVSEMAQGPHDRSAHQLMGSVVESVLRTDSAAAAAKWAEALPNELGRQIAMSRVAHRYTEDDPSGAMSWAEAQEGHPQVIGEVGHHLARKDPAEAVEWVTSLPESPGQHAGMHRSMHEWAAKDPTAASAYLNELPESRMKDAAISGFTRRLAWEDPQSALAWAETISFEKERMETTIRVAQAWARKDQAAAADWVVASGLPEKAQRVILDAAADKR